MTQNGEAERDLRVRRTRRALQKAMLELTVEEGFTALTVGGLCKRAMVNRATFYRHYQDKYELLEHFIREVYELTYAGEDSSDTDSVASGLVRLLQHVRDLAAFYRVMLGPKGEPGFAHRVRHYIEQRLRAYLPDIHDAPARDARLLPPDLNLSYAAYAGIGLILWWVEHTEQYTPEQVATWLSQLTEASLSLSLRASEPAG